MSLFPAFERHLLSKVSLTDHELQQIRAAATERKLRRKELLLREGDTCRHKAFVVSGLLRTYRTADGIDYIMRFAPEDTWNVDAESYNNVAPSKYNIEAMEDTEVLLWQRDDINTLFDTIPAFRAYSDKLITRSLEITQNRVLANISYTAEEKYLDFITSFPDVFNRVPLHMVASYLGVSRETLSRIRHAQLRK